MAIRFNQESEAVKQKQTGTKKIKMIEKQKSILLVFAAVKILFNQKLMLLLFF